MANFPIVIPLESTSFETAVRAMANDPGFVAIDGIGGARGRFAIAASNPASIFSFSGGFVTQDGHTVIDSPRDALKQFLASAPAFERDPYLPFSGGAIGYIGFEGARAIRGFAPADGFSRFPQCSFGIYEVAAVFDRIEGTARVIAARGDGAGAGFKAEALADQLFAADPWDGTAHLPCDRSFAPRFIPESAAFNELIEDAFSMLRADKLSRVHLTRHALSPAGGFTAAEFFLSGGDASRSRAIFGHSGAFAIAATDAEAAATSGARAVLPAQDLPFALHAARFAGEPFDEALGFLSQREEEHRRFYGGSFGIVDAQGAQLWTIGEATCIADGAIHTIAGADFDAADDPRSFAQRMESQLVKAIQRA